MSTVAELRAAAIDAVEGLYSACERDVDKLETKITSLEEQVTDLEDANERIQERYARPEWGNCCRGCPPSYLDREGFCSPACHVGAPRGEFVTLAVTAA